MKRTWILCLLIVAALMGSGCGGDAGGDDDGAKPRLVVSAAASLKAAFTSYGKAFDAGDARFSFAGSDLLATQIRQGARPDVFASANTKLPDQLYTLGLVEQPIRFASNELVLATRKGNRSIRSLPDIQRKGVRLAIGSPTVPVGSYTRVVLGNVAPAQRRAILANVRSEEPDVTGIVGKLTQSAVDAGFVYETDVRAANNKLNLIRLPPSLSPRVIYGVAVVKGAREPAVARQFVYGLVSGAGRAALTRAAFGAPAPY